MTINRKDSRKLVQDGEIYAWTISPDSGFIVFVAEHRKIKGSRINVYIHSDINQFWVKFPHVEGLHLKIDLTLFENWLKHPEFHLVK